MSSETNMVVTWYCVDHHAPVQYANLDKKNYDGIGTVCAANARKSVS